MSAVLTPLRPAQPSIFDIDASTGSIIFANNGYTPAERDADRQLCQDYLQQWTSAFKLAGAATAITTDAFNAAAARLAG